MMNLLAQLKSKLSSERELTPRPGLGHKVRTFSLLGWRFLVTTTNRRKVAHSELTSHHLTFLIVRSRILIFKLFSFQRNNIILIKLKLYSANDNLNLPYQFPSRYPFSTHERVFSGIYLI